jgi:hypothetical protein
VTIPANPYLQSHLGTKQMNTPSTVSDTQSLVASMDESERTAIANAPVTPLDVPDVGKRSRRVFMMKTMASADWIMANVVAKGKGTQASLGRLYGTVHKVDKKVGDIQGRPSVNYPLSGVFESISALTGELAGYTTAYLPESFALQMYDAMQVEGVLSLELDIDIGVEATGKSIPYEWMVTSFIPIEGSNRLLEMRHRRQTKMVDLPLFEALKTDPPFPKLLKTKD